MSGATERLTRALADRYRIERELGAGGMATVLLAQDLKHDRKVAIKVLKPELAAVLGAERFVQEIKTTAALSHPHILPLFDSGEAGGFLYYVMPFIEGETIRDRLNRESQLGVDEAVRIASEVADALDYAHRHGVIHRDIKPENILLHDGRPMVMDFGIALAVSAAAGGRMTETGLSLGTPHYMSPEQATAEKDITARSDIYSLATVLYEMLAGQPPHLGGTAQQIIMKIIVEPVKPVTELRKSVPPHVSSALSQALEKLPADRFATAKGFADALANPHFTSASSGLMSGAVPVAADRKVRGALAAALAVILLLGGWILTRPTASLPVSRYALALPPEQLPFDGGFVAVSPDGSQIAYLGALQSGAVSGRIWIKSRDKLEPVPIPGTDLALAAAFSPDSRSLAVVEGPSLRRVSLDGGGTAELARGVANGAQTVAWLDDGTIAYSTRVGATSAILSIPEAGGESTTLWSSDTMSAYGLSPLPDGRGLLFLSCPQPCARSNLMVLDGRSGDARVLVEDARYGAYLPTGHLLMVRPTGVAGVVAPFDLGSLSLTGEEVAVLDSVANLASFAYLAVSKSGTLVYRSGRQIMDQRLELVSIDRSGRGVRLDTNFVFTLTQFAGDYGWSLSPDATKLAIGLYTSSGDDIWIKSLPRGPLSRATFGAGAERRPRWLPDGRSITYISDNGGIFMRRADGTGRDSLLLAVDANEAAFTPDGKWLIVRSGARGAVSGGRDIYGMRIGVDTALQDLIVTEFDENAFDVSPDGRWIAYESDETGRREIFVRPFPNTRDAKFLVSNGGGLGPRWARNGRELYFVSPGNRMMAASISSASGFDAGEPQALFTLPRVMEAYANSWYTAWDVTPDGRFIVVQSVSQQGETFDRPLIVVENWFEEVRRRAGR